MSLLKKLLAVLFLLAGIVVVGGFVLPSQTHVERSTRIARSPGEVHAMLNSWRRFNEWSPWHGRDPKTLYTYAGPADGVGASMKWSSEQSDVGKGRQTIVESVPDYKVVSKLEFEGQGDAIAAFVLLPEGGGTRVTWAFDTDHGNDIMGRWFGLMFDRWIGPDYEQGLAKLKAVLEAQPE